MVVLDSLKIVTINVLFRFFFIVHADKGFVVGKKLGQHKIFQIFQVAGKLNTRLANGIYAILRCKKQIFKLSNFRNPISIQFKKSQFNSRNFEKFQRYN